MWHPILQAVEDRPAHWVMYDSLDRAIGEIELRRVSAGPRYRVAFRGELIGWAASLKVACEHLNGAFLRSHSPGFRSGAPSDAELEEARRRVAKRA